MDNKTSIRIDALLIGRAATFGPNDEPSAMVKTPVAGAISVGPLGLHGDEQADLLNHGGVDKAIHHYPRDHYPYWQETLAQHPLLNHAGAFGENVSSLGLTEDIACIGDRFRLGSALVEISQGRQPCWKLGHHFSHASVVARVVSTGKSGWYYRVIESGSVSAGDSLTLLDRPYENWTVAHVFNLLLAGGHKAAPDLVQPLARLEPLSDSWKRRAQALKGT
jgi:MOSC domain-containing protein YiiM